MPVSTPERGASKVTWVPGFQYAFGRQATRSLPVRLSVSQPHEPSVPLFVVTFRRRSVAALFVTLWSKVSESGRPAPTVVTPPSPRGRAA